MCERWKQHRERVRDALYSLRVRFADRRAGLLEKTPVCASREKSWPPLKTRRGKTLADKRDFTDDGRMKEKTKSFV
jgi:hypothetical protein